MANEETCTYPHCESRGEPCRESCFPKGYSQKFTDAEQLRARIATLESALEESQRLATARHSNIAKAVYGTVQDSAATWDTASDSLIWDAYDQEGPQHQKVTDEHLAATCVRYPQWADDLRSFAKQWNEDEPLTDEMLNAVEVDEEEIARGTRRAMQIIRFYNKLHAVESALAAAKADAERLDWILDKLAGGESIDFDPKWLHPIGTKEHTKQGLRDEIDRARSTSNEQAKGILCKRCGQNVGDGDVDGCRDHDCPEAK